MNMISSVSTKNTSALPSSLCLSDIITALKKRGRIDEAEAYQLYVTVYLDFVHGVPEDEALKMSIDDVTKLLVLPPKPLRYEGWNFYWGKAAFGRDSS